MSEFLNSLQPFWLWLAVACIFLAIEVLIVPSGFFLCLGTSAAIVAAVLFFVPAISWLWAFTLFAALTVASGIFWWKVVRKRSKMHEEQDEGTLNVKTRQLIGYRATLDEDIKNGRGRIRVNDSAWPVTADADYPAGTRVEVVAVQGITLTVQKVQE